MKKSLRPSDIDPEVVELVGLMMEATKTTDMGKRRDVADRINSMGINRSEE